MNNEKLTILENPCHNCYESYCYKNCDKYTEWEKDVESVKESIEQIGLTRFFLPKELLIEFKSGYGNHKDRMLYRCPKCKKLLSKSLCESNQPIKHCYRCGQLIKNKE